MGIKDKLQKLKPISQIFKQSPREVQQKVEAAGNNAAQAASYVAGNKTEAIQAITNGIVDTTKGSVTAHSGKRLGNSVLKDVKDYTKGDVLCTVLCAVSGTCEVIAGVIIWVPVSGKIVCVSGLKAISYGCMSIRDLCNAEPGNPLC